MLKTEEKTIDGVTYRVTQLPSKRGRALLVRLFKLAGPAFGEALGSLDPKQVRVTDIKVESLGAALRELASRLTETDLDFMVDTLAEQTQVQTPGTDNWPQLSRVADIHFAGEYARLFKWLWFAIEVNYFGFLSGRGGLAAFLAPKAAAANQSPSPIG